MKSFDIDPNEYTYSALVKLYSEKHRYYHTGEHIAATLRQLDNVLELAEKPAEIELALWFHDAIYKPFSTTNELDSAHLAEDFLINNSVSSEVSDRVHGLIMATCHTAIQNGRDESLIIDIDLTVLGALDDIYQTFEETVRKEYRLVPSLIYKKKRKEVLCSFLERDRIYQNNYFFEERERQARINLTNAISVL